MFFEQFPELMIYTRDSKSKPGESDKSIHFRIKGDK